MPYGKHKKEEQELQHQHTWKTNSFQSEKNCSCGAILVSSAEYERRDKIWRKYFEAVWESPAYLNFVKAKEAWLNHDKLALKETVEVARKLRAGGNWLVKPKFPDPHQTTRYVISEGGI